MLPVSHRPSSNSYGNYTLLTGLQLSKQDHWIQEKHITQSEMADVYYQHVYSCQCKVTVYRRNIKPQPLWPLCITNKLTAVDSRSLNTGETSNSNYYGRCVLTKRLQLSIQGHWIVNKHPTETVMTIERWITRLQVPLKGHLPLNSSPPSN